MESGFLVRFTIVFNLKNLLSEKPDFLLILISLNEVAFNTSPTNPCYCKIFECRSKLYYKRSHQYRKF